MLDRMVLKSSVNADEIGQSIYCLISELYPICRSITGEGVRETLRRLKQIIPLTIHEIPTGTEVFDWTVPKEWNIRDAYVKDSDGNRIIDFHKSNLHVLNYSIPIHKMLPLPELKEHLFSLPDHPDWIPYRTSYYREDWGFCLSHRQLITLEEGDYEVLIDSSLENGSLTYGEFFLQGEKEDEILISCHICHPSLANDNLSGLTLTAFLAKQLSNLSLRYSYRFLFSPGTIGAITWLSLNEEKTPRIKHGLVVACVGDSGQFTYKRSRRGNEEIDRAVTHVLHCSGKEHDLVDFSPYGYDERQYCSPGFNLPVGSLTRTPHGCFPQYHTSGDNLDFVKPECLTESFLTYLSVFRVLEGNMRYRNLNLKCEPQLGRRGLYNAIGGGQGRNSEMAMLWVLNLSDGGHSLLDIAERAGLAFDEVRISADHLINHGLLALVEG
jgi:aminopeptidase-like protein